MAKLRKFVSYRRLERPYTRVSKFRKLSYIRARPNITLVKYNMGNTKKDIGTYPAVVQLVAEADLQIRHNALESGRQTALRLLEKVLGKTGFHFRVKLFPHHILRENPLASGAGADRMSTGMAMSFGKTIGTAAQVRRGQVLYEVGLPTTHIQTAKTALKRTSMKLPCKGRVVVLKQ